MKENTSRVKFVCKFRFISCLKISFESIQYYFEVTSKFNYQLILRNINYLILHTQKKVSLNQTKFLWIKEICALSGGQRKVSLI